MNDTLTPLLGRKALVTGSARRVGRELALGLARAGCDVIVHHHRSEEAAQRTAQEIQSLGRRAEVLRADLGIHGDVLRLGVEAAEALGGLDILINSASSYPAGDHLEAQHSLTTETLDGWEESLAVNTRAPFFLIQQLVPALEKRGRGCVINILDRSAFVPFRSRAAHTVSKAGLYAVTKLAAASLTPRIRVNALELGAILPGDEMEPDERARLRWGGVESVVNGALFLLTSPFVNGEVVGVKGDAFSYGGQ